MAKGKATSSERLTYSVPEAGALIGVGRNQAYEAAKAGQLPTIKIGNRILVPRAALNELLANPSRQPAKAA